MSEPFAVLGVAQDATEAQVRRAYHEKARRWHPDRFPEGPERLWAEQKMTQINVAYHEAIQVVCGNCRGGDELTPDGEKLQDVKKLLQLGQLSAARQALMRVATRNAEWNYLFGAVLLRLGEYEKAALYFGIACRQRPQDRQYKTAYLSAEAIRNRKKTKSIFSRLRSTLLGGRSAP